MFKLDVTYQTLSQYLSEIKEFIYEAFDYQWIVAEIAKIDSDKNGHYWIDLVEKKDNEIVAKCDAVIWKGNVDIVYNFYLKTGMELQKGIKILFRGKATFHEKHGFKISISQIDPSFSLGEMALKKKETIERLAREGLTDKNKTFEIPLVIQRIAIVSSESAAGYEDFLKILKENNYGFNFYTKLFDAFVQGESAVASLIEAFQRCAYEANSFDAVVLIRGGGSVVDLAVFNDYELAKTIALMPIPVFTGIGHTRDETVADFVASMSFKTPSEAAKFILDKALDFSLKIETLRHNILKKVERFLSIEIPKNKSFEERFKLVVKNSVDKLSQKINLIESELHKSVLKKVHSERDLIFTVKQKFYKIIHSILREKSVEIANINNQVSMKMKERIKERKFKIESLKERLETKSKNAFNIKAIQIERAFEKLHLLSPENILRRGYSITYLNGKALKNSHEVPIGANIQIQLYRGKISGQVINKEENHGELKLF